MAFCLVSSYYETAETITLLYFAWARCGKCTQKPLMIGNHVHISIWTFWQINEPFLPIKPAAWECLVQGNQASQGQDTHVGMPADHPCNTLGQSLPETCTQTKKIFWAETFCPGGARKANPLRNGKRFWNSCFWTHARELQSLSMIFARRACYSLVLAILFCGLGFFSTILFCAFLLLEGLRCSWAFSESSV